MNGKKMGRFGDYIYDDPNGILFGTREGQSNDEVH